MSQNFPSDQIASKTVLPTPVFIQRAYIPPTWPTGTPRFHSFHFCPGHDPLTRFPLLTLSISNQKERQFTGQATRFPPLRDSGSGCKEPFKTTWLLKIPNLKVTLLEPITKTTLSVLFSFGLQEVQKACVVGGMVSKSFFARPPVAVGHVVRQGSAVWSHRLCLSWEVAQIQVKTALLKVGRVTLGSSSGMCGRGFVCICTWGGSVSPKWTWCVGLPTVAVKTQPLFLEKHRGPTRPLKHRKRYVFS